MARYWRQSPAGDSRVVPLSHQAVGIAHCPNLAEGGMAIVDSRQAAEERAESRNCRLLFDHKRRLVPIEIRPDFRALPAAHRAADRHCEQR
jgi:hypothetical protein